MARNVSVSSEPSKYAQAVSIASHVFHANEPFDVGGGDIGPNPHELVMASLGACASITAQMYAKRKQWNLQSVHIDVAYRRVLAADNAVSAATLGMLDQFEMQISLAGDLSDDQRNKLFEMANRCPIHRMLTSGVKIQARLSAGAAQAGNSSEASKTTSVGESE